MRTLRFEFKRSLTPRNVVVMIVFLVVSLYFVQTGVQQYRDIEKNRKEFQEIEALKVRSFNNWEQYGGYGFRLYYMPSVLSIFFDNSNLFTELTAHIDVGEKLDIYDTFKGKRVFTHKPGRRLDFAGIFLLFGSLMALFYGFEGFKDREYLRFLSSMFRHRWVYWYIWLSRVILMSLFFLFVFGSALILLNINGIFNLLTGQWLKLMVFLVVMLMMQAIFFSMGSIAASFESRMKGVFIFLGWFFLVYLLPVLFNIIVAVNSRDMVTNYQSEYQKLTVLMNFEKEVMIRIASDLAEYRELQKIVVYPPEEVLPYRKLTGMYNWVERQVKNLEKGKQYNKDILPPLRNFRRWLGTQRDEEVFRIKNLDSYKTWMHAQTRSKELLAKISQVRSQMMADYTTERFEERMLGMEMELVEDMQGKGRTLQVLYGVFPTTFYLAVNNEISSRGYRGVIDFHRYAREIKREFFHFYSPKKLEEDEARSRGEGIPKGNFFENEKIKTKGLSNVLSGVSRFPDIFVFGFGFMIFWTAFIPLLSYRFYKRSLFKLSREDAVYANRIKLDLKDSEVNVVFSNDRAAVCDRLYNNFSGKSRGGDVRIAWNGIDPAGANERMEFVYLCHPGDLPGDIKPSDFARFLLGGSPGELKDNWEIIRDKLNLRWPRFRRFAELSNLERGLILAALVLSPRPKTVYLMDNFTRDMSGKDRDDFIQYLQELDFTGAVILYLTDDRSQVEKIDGDFTFI